MIIKTIHVWTDGDASVGICGESATITADGDNLFDSSNYGEPSDAMREIEKLRKDLAMTFGYLWDDKVHVIFDFETDKEES